MQTNAVGCLFNKYNEQIMLTESARQIISHLFVEAYYIQQVGIDTLNNCSPFEHFLQTDINNLCQPHPLFDPSFYIENSCDVAAAGLNPLVHYAIYGWKERRAIHPLFDDDYYIEQIGDKMALNEPAVFHFLRTGLNTKLSPHPLFSSRHYLSNARNAYTGNMNPLLHYILHGYKENRSVHPLFLEDYYRSQCNFDIPSDEPALLHYLRTGRKTGISPHPLFDAEHYFKQSDDLVALKFDPLTHYLKYGFRENRNSFHPLFDSDYYLKHWATLNKDAGQQIDNPLLLHYVEVGSGLNVSPSLLFDPLFYRQQNKGVDFSDLDPLTHYLMTGFKEHRNPHPFFVSKYYANKAKLSEPKTVAPILHFLSAPREKRVSPNPCFDKKFYIESNSDINWCHICPFMHFLENGKHEGRAVNRLQSDTYISHLYPSEHFRNISPAYHYMKNSCSRPIRIVFVSHEASQTGAPLILLNIVKFFSSFANTDCFVVVHGQGPLVSQFAKYAHVLVTEQWGDELTTPPADCDIAYLLERLADNPPVAVLSNSLESRYYSVRFANAGIPVFSLVHEMPNFYRSRVPSLVGSLSRLMIAPSNEIGDCLRALAPMYSDRVVVLGQGLLNPRFGTMSREVARHALYEEFGFESDAVIVLGCGTLDGRKGIDHFVRAAVKMLRVTSKNVYWLWVGDGPSGYHSVRYWAEYEICKHDLNDRIRFVGARSEVESYFVGADVFVLTSRADPFPCVVHEAMAAALPVVCFEGGGGAQEQIGECGVVVPNGDANALAKAVNELVDDGARRHELGLAARRRVHAVFNFDVYNKKIAELIRCQLHQQTGWLEPSPRRRSGKRGRILFTFPGWMLSGVNTSTESLIEGLIARGFDAEIVFTLGRYTGPDIEQHIPSVPYRFIQSADHYIPTIWKAVEEAIAEEAPCVIVPQYDYRISAISARLPANVGIVGVGHSDDDEHYEHIYRLGLYWNHIIAVTGTIAQKILSLNPGFANKLSVIPYGVPMRNRDMKKGGPVAEKRHLRVTYLGRFEIYQKRIYDYALLAELLAKSGIPFKLRLIGDGQELDTMRIRLGHLISQGQVEMPGRLDRSEILSALDDTDVLLILSDFEGLPLSMLEGMSCGCIPLVYNIRSGISDVIEDGVNGLIVPRGDVRNAAYRLIELAKDTELRSRLSSAARETIIHRGLTLDHMADAYADVFDRVLAEITSPKTKPRLCLTRNSLYNGVALPPFLYPKTLSLKDHC